MKINKNKYETVCKTLMCVVLKSIFHEKRPRNWYPHAQLAVPVRLRMRMVPPRVERWGLGVFYPLGRSWLRTRRTCGPTSAEPILHVAVVVAVVVIVVEDSVVAWCSILIIIIITFIIKYHQISSIIIKCCLNPWWCLTASIAVPCFFCTQYEMHMSLRGSPWINPLANASSSAACTWDGDATFEEKEKKGKRRRAQTKITRKTSWRRQLLRLKP